MRLFKTGLIFISALFLGSSIFAQEINQTTSGKVNGTVRTSDGKPASYVNVSIKELNKKTTTTEDGSYQIGGIKPGIYTIESSYIGFSGQVQTLTVSPAKTTKVDFVLAENAAQLSEVVITAWNSSNKQAVSIGKLPVASLDLPQSVAVVGNQQITQQQSLRLSDVVKNINGVYLGTARGSTQETFYARGYSFSSNNMFKNGSRINSGAMPEVSSIERVEVLKGSAAILFGNVAPGGILNLVTKQPKFSRGAEISMRVGSYSLYKPSLDVYGPITAKLAYRINGSYENAESFRKGVSSERYYINPSLLFKLGKQTELLVQGDHLHHNFTPDFGTGAINNQIAHINRSTFLGAAWSNGTTRQTTASATLNHQFNTQWQLSFAGSYQFYNRAYYSTERIQPDATGEWTRPLNRSNVDEDYYTSQVNLTGKFLTGRLKHTLLTGADFDSYLNTTFTYNQPATYDKINILDLNKYPQRTDIPAATAIKAVEAPTNRFGIYANDLIALSDKFNVLMGLRWSYQKAMPSRTKDLLTHAVTKAAAKNDRAFSPRIGLVYKPLPTTSLFASYANSFTVNSGTDVYGKILKPSLIDQFEVGIKNDIFKGLMSVNLTAYRIINNNLAQTAVYAADGTTLNTNTSFKELTGETTSDGMELDIAGHPAAGLDVMAGYSYNYMRYTKTPDAPGNYIEGERLVNSPAHTANASIFYTLQSTNFRGLKLGATANYIGKRLGGWNNTIGQTQTGSRLIPVSAFSTIDLSAGYSFKKLSVLAKVSNLTNTLNYYVHENYSVNPIPPRQFVTTVSYKF